MLAAVALLAAIVLLPHALAPLPALCLGALAWFGARGDALAGDGKSGAELDPTLAETDSRFSAFFEQSLVGLYVVQDGVIVYCNDKNAQLLGYECAEDLIGTAVEDVTAPEDRELLRDAHRRRLAGEAGSMRYVYRALRRDGQRMWAEVHGSPCEYRGRPAVMGVALDISSQVALEQQSRLATRVFESASEGIVITDADCRIEAVNPAFTRITGYDAAQAVGKRSRMMTGQGARAKINRDMLAHLAKDGHWQGEMRDRRRNGAWYPAWLSISTVRDGEGKITNYVGVFTDNTRRKEDETRLQFLASHDSLTGLLNRSGMMVKFASEIVAAHAAGRQLALLFIDLDRFKTVNDTLGHLTGDRLLLAVAERMRQHLGDVVLAARPGGDEFTVLMDDPPASGAAARMAERLIAGLAQPFVIDGHEMFVTASIGIACHPTDGSDAATLLKNADVAMYRAKQRGRNTFQFFTSDMNSESFEQMLLENSLRRAIERSEFVLYYQPQFSTGDGRITGVEALIRWNHPELGLVQPATFIPMAEQNGLIVKIGAWVLLEACRQAQAWLDIGLQFGRVAVNLSARQFSSEDLLDTIRTALDESGLPPDMLELEITESTIMHNPQEAVSLLDRIRAMGVVLSIDDFGTGYSSLASLKQYPLDSLKIDRGFIHGIPHDADDVAITEAIIAIAHKMRLKVVAEGVETSDQADFLRRAGCDAEQGFLLGRPMNAREMTQRLLQ